MREELDDEEKKLVEQAERTFGHLRDREQQLPYGWTVPGIFDLNGIVHFPPGGGEPYSDGTVTGLIYGSYKLTKAHPRARLYDDRVRNRLEIVMVLEELGGGYVHARLCHRGLLGAWRCEPWHFLKGWYGK